MKPVPIEEYDVHQKIDHKHEDIAAVKTTETISAKDEENDFTATNELTPKPVKSPTEFTAAVVPIAIVCIIFVAAGAMVLIFRKRINLVKRQDSKDDMVCTSQ